MGESTHIQSASLFQLYWFSTKVLFSVTKRGPFSIKRLAVDAYPGPPASQIPNGSVELATKEPSLFSKPQKKSELFGRLAELVEIEPAQLPGRSKVMFGSLSTLKSRQKK
jgi:hypothetical protein